MQADTLRNFLNDFLGTLPSRSDGKLWTMRMLTTETGVSRSTIYTWLNGAPPSGAGLQHFAGKLAELKIKWCPDSKEPAQQLSSIILESLKAATLGGDSQARDGFGFVKYPPVCDLPSSASWSFLGEILGRYEESVGRRSGGSQIDVSAFEGLDEALLAGLFSTAERVHDWSFFRTPIQIPLNGLVLWRDLRACVLALAKSRPSIAKMSAEVFKKMLQDALWRPSVTDLDTPLDFKKILFPMTVAAEAGRTYVTKVFGFPVEKLPTRQGKDDYSIDLHQLKEWLVQESKQFNESLKCDSLSDPKLPVLILDELTCLSFLRAFPKGWGDTELTLLSNPKEDLLTTSPLRPRFCVSIAISKHHKPNEVKEIKASLEEFLWSNTSIAIKNYANLFLELVDIMAHIPILEEFASIYALRWLSLDLCKDDCRQLYFNKLPYESLSKCVRSIPAICDGIAWNDILVGTKELLLNDPKLREGLRTSLKHLDYLGSKIEPSGTAQVG